MAGPVHTKQRGLQLTGKAMMISNVRTIMHWGVARHSCSMVLYTTRYSRYCCHTINPFELVSLSYMFFIPATLVILFRGATDLSWQRTRMQTLFARPLTGDQSQVGL